MKIRQSAGGCSSVPERCTYYIVERRQEVISVCNDQTIGCAAVAPGHHGQVSHTCGGSNFVIFRSGSPTRFLSFLMHRLRLNVASSPQLKHRIACSGTSLSSNCDVLANNEPIVINCYLYKTTQLSSIDRTPSCKATSLP